MDFTKEFRSLDWFRDRPVEALQHLGETGRPVVLTVDGRAAAVVQDTDAYQRLLDLAAQGSASEGIRQGLDDLVDRRTKPAAELFDSIRATYGISR